MTPAFATKTMTLKLILGNATGKTVQCPFRQQSSPTVIGPDEKKTVYIKLRLQDNSEQCLDNTPCMIALEFDVAKDNDGFYFNYGSWVNFSLYADLMNDVVDNNNPLMDPQENCHFIP